MKVIESAPHFFVTDIHRSVRFYVDVLGFAEPELWGDPPGFAMPHRDGFIVMLNQASADHVNPNGRRNGWDAYFWCQGVDAFYESIRNRAEIVHGPEDRALYGMREIGVRDPDGYMLVFAEDLQPATAPDA